MKLRHFYHLGSDGRWKMAAREHIAAIRAAGLPGEVTVGITGPETPAMLAEDWLAQQWPEADVSRGGSGSEPYTLRLARSWAREHPDGVVLYAHTKGAHNPSVVQEAWRQSMTLDVVTGWRACVAALRDHDVAGPHWLTPQQYPNMLIATEANGGSTTPYFGGNFWWATAKYLASLPPPGILTRWAAERWIGLNRPRAADMHPGWPSIMVFSGPMAERVLAKDFNA